jgi:hypothetical protein
VSGLAACKRKRKSEKEIERERERERNEAVECVFKADIGMICCVVLCLIR